MKKELIALGMILLIAGCTQQTSTYTGAELEELPELSIDGMNELGDLPETNISVDLGGGAIGSNPFPDEPSLI